MFEQYKELNSIILRAAQTSLDTARASDNGFIYTIIEDEELSMNGPKVDIKLIAMLIRSALAMKAFGENYEGFAI